MGSEVIGLLTKKVFEFTSLDNNIVSQPLFAYKYHWKSSDLQEDYGEIQLQINFSWRKLY